MAIHREELQIDYGRTGERFRNVRIANGAPGTCSGIQGVPVGDNPVMGLDGNLQDSHQY